MKKIITIFALILLVCVGCSNNEERIVECRKKDGDTIKIATITKKNGEIVLNKEDIIEECIGDICSYDTNSVEEKVEDFDETVNEYKKEGYTCEQK